MPEPDLAVIERLDRIAAVEDAALLYPAIESGSIVQRQVQRQSEQLLEIFAREAKPAADQDHVTDAKVLADEVIERNAPHRQIAAMICRLELDRAGLRRRIVSRQCVERLDLE